MSASSPAPGWYPDPVGGGSRWWDGRMWTDFRHAPSVTVVEQRPLPDGVSTGTRWIHLQVVVPLAQLLAQLLAQVPYMLSFRGLFAAQIASMAEAHGSRLPPAAAAGLVQQYTGELGVFALTLVLSLLLSAAWVLLAFLDRRQLERIGVVQPFHWAWSFLGVVYPIGRAVVVHRRTGRGLAPLWLLIGSVVASMVLTFVLEAVILLPSFAELASAAGSTSGCGCG